MPWVQVPLLPGPGRRSIFAIGAGLFQALAELPEFLLAQMKRRRIEGVVDAFDEVAHAHEGGHV